MATNYSDILLVNGDIDLSNNDIQLITTNLESMRQRLFLRFNIWKGEWLYNIDFGTPWRSYLGVSMSNVKSSLDAEIKRQVFKEPDVVSISSFKSEYDRNKRTYKCYFVVETNEEEAIPLAYFLSDDFTYTVPEVNPTTCKEVADTILYGNMLYKLINYDMHSGGISTWIPDWQ